MRPRRGLRMILNAKDRLFPMRQTFHSFVIQINPIHFDIIRKSASIERKSMVLGGNFYLSRREMLDRLIRSPVAKFKFERLSSERKTEHLMPKTAPEHRNAMIHQAPDVLDDILPSRGITRAIR